MSEQPTGRERTEVDSRLSESEARYRALIENASDMVQSCRPDGTYEFVNPAWLQKLGYTEDELEGLVVWDIIAPESLPHCQVAFERAVQGESLENIRATFLAKDGRKVPVEGSATTRFVDGKPIATHSFFRDISERLRAEELEAKNLQLEQERLARYLEKMAALGKLAAGLAHELNNPAAAAQRAAAQLTESTRRLDASLIELHRLSLGSQTWEKLHTFKDERPASLDARKPVEVSRLEDEMADWLVDHGVDDAWDLAAELVHDGVGPERLNVLAEEIPEGALKAALTWLADSGETKELTDVISRSTQRISELVAAVKAYSFMDQAAEQIVDVHDGLENTLTILGHRLRGFAVHREYDHGLPAIRAFGSGLNQVWTNILDNAIDALGQQGTITIRTRRQDYMALVEIEDDGPGIPPEYLSRVFEPFFSTKAQGEGTGLGLDTVWRIVTEEHNGTVEVESEPGCTRFRIGLPIAEA